MSDERYSRKDKIEAAREERRIRTQAAVSDSNFTKRIWTIAGAASTFVLVASLSLGVGIGLGTGNIVGGSNVASGSNNSGSNNTGGAPVVVDPNAAANGAETLTKGAQSNPANAATNAFVFTGLGEIIASDPSVTGQPAVDNVDKVDLKIYLDYACSFCKIFEDVESNNLKNALAEGDVTISYNIMAFLGNYSNAAGNASACVASLEPERWDEVHLALFAGQSGGQSYTTDGAAGGYVKNLLQPFGLSDETNSCITEMRHLDWLQTVTQSFFSTPQDSSGGLIQGTPTVVADGTSYMGEAFQQVGNIPGLLAKHRAMLNE
jgi:protein-disulfide isomerase